MITATNAQDWRTPLALFNGLDERYRFTLDIAASLGNACLPSFWTTAHFGGRGAFGAPDGAWSNQRVWCNPPFRQIGPFLELILSKRHLVSCAAVLLPANIDTAWFHGLGVYFQKWAFRGRVAYEPPPGVAASTPSFPSMLAVCGPGIQPSGYGFVGALDARTGAVLS